MDPTAMEFEPGTKLGPYEIIGPLGAGGMGQVYKARDTRMGRLVAIKVSFERFSGRFEREVRAISALNHPNICTLYDIGPNYLVMELVEGESLASLLRKGPVSTEPLLRYGIQIAEALQAAHAHGIVHRDLKPANIMLAKSGAKVLDFGLAKHVQPSGADSTVTLDAITEAGTVAGTLLYMAPEALRGEPADARTDLWALGVVLYEMVTGQRPFHGHTAFEISSAILREPAPALPAFAPAGLNAVIQRCLEKEPDRRYQSAAELRAALETFAPSKAIATAAPTSVGRKPWLLAAAVVVALAVTFLAWKLSPIGRGRSSVALASSGMPASKNPKANEYFERALVLARFQADWVPARLMLEKALEADPHFAEARRWHAFALVLMIYRGESNDTGLLYKAEEELRQAAQDEPNLASIHSALAVVYLHEGRKELVPAEVEKSVKALPNDPEALIWLLNYYRLNGQNAEATALAKAMTAREPLFPPPRMMLGETLRSQGDTAGAIRELEGILEQVPDNIRSMFYLSQAYMDAGNLEKARAILQRARSLVPKNFLIRQAWAHLLALEGKREEALQEMDAEVLKYSGATFVSTVEAAEVYALLGDTAKALEWLEKAVHNGDERAEWFRRDPSFASLRQDPRFQQILDSVTYRQKQRTNK